MKCQRLLFLCSLLFSVAAAPARAVSLTEIGTNDFVIGNVGPDGNTTYGAFEPAIAYNSQDDQYLVVWWGNSDLGGLASDEDEIWGRRLDGAGNQIGGIIRISDAGTDGDGTRDAFTPAVAYNSQDNQYLVVWYADDDGAGLADDEYEIFGQRLDAAGNEIGTNDFRISDLGGTGDNTFKALQPKVAYSSRDNQYLAVWRGRDTGFSVGETEIFGQMLNASGAEIGSNDFLVSTMGGGIGDSFSGDEPDVAYNSSDNEFLVVWRGDDNTVAEKEIFGQRIDSSGAEVGTDDFQISHMGADGDTSITQKDTAVAYDPDDNLYLAVWDSDNDSGGLVIGEFEIYGQLLTGAGVETGPDDFRVSDMGPDGDANYDASVPDVTFNSAAGEFLVVWYGDDDTGSLVDGENEIYAQRVLTTGLEADSDTRISDLGPDGNTGFEAVFPAVAPRAGTPTYLVVFDGDDDTAPQVGNEYEIWGQRLQSPLRASSYTGVDAVKIFPNPFRPSKGHTSVTLNQLPASASIEIFTIAGERVRSLTADRTGAATWDGKNDSGDAVSSGVYLIYFKAGSSDDVKKIVVQR